MNLETFFICIETFSAPAFISAAANVFVETATGFGFLLVGLRFCAFTEKVKHNKHAKPAANIVIFLFIFIFVFSDARKSVGKILS